MRFKVRSLGGKLIVFVALTLLLCLLLFVISSWVLLMLYANHVAQGGVLQHTLGNHTSRFVLLIIGLGIMIFAFGAVFMMVIIRKFFVHPLQQLQSRVNTLVANDNVVQPLPPGADELSVLNRSFSLLSESLDKESQVMTEQMSNILIMSDALISTINLEHLLGEIVSRLGHIMRARNVSLLLYGREMLSPWAVAQWSAPLGPTTQLPTTSLNIQ